MLLLLYAQPLVRVVTFPTSIIDDADSGMSIMLGTHPTDVPEPSMGSLRRPAHQRPVAGAQGLGFPGTGRSLNIRMPRYLFITACLWG